MKQEAIARRDGTIDRRRASLADPLPGILSEFGMNLPLLYRRNEDDLPT